ncbi:MAG: hypothetical protein ACKO65_09320, partial [Betaproteobacteria bacterium]
VACGGVWLAPTKKTGRLPCRVQIHPCWKAGGDGSDYINPILPRPLSSCDARYKYGEWMKIFYFSARIIVYLDIKSPLTSDDRAKN